VVNSTPRPPYPQERDTVPIVKEAGWAPGRKITPPPGFDPRTVQPVASRYTDYAILAHTSTTVKLGKRRTGYKTLDGTLLATGKRTASFAREAHINAGKSPNKATLKLSDLQVIEGRERERERRKKTLVKFSYTKFNENSFSGHRVVKACTLTKLSY
jgi:hypothetical protein